MATISESAPKARRRGKVHGLPARLRFVTELIDSVCIWLVGYSAAGLDLSCLIAFARDSSIGIGGLGQRLRQGFALMPWVKKAADCLGDGLDLILANLRVHRQR